LFLCKHVFNTYYTEKEFNEKFDYAEIWEAIDVLSYFITKEEQEAIWKITYKPFQVFK